ncbi:MAG: recombinase family protein, partial [Leucobacter sp.]
MSVATPPQQPIQAADPFAALTQSLTPKRAVSYLRVSTREQAERGGREEGFSIPAQREANKKKAQSMGALVAKEFVERGVSGTSTNRPALQAMLRYLEEEAEHIDYVIVHKLDRLARNRADEVTLSTRFTELGIRLVSTSENIDQTPGGMLLQGIMSSIAEFYSRNLANEVLKGMNEKVRNGGTIGRAPIGYLNTRDFSTGQEIRTVVVDTERAPHIIWAFEQYATGEWTLRTIAEELGRRGLTTVPTPRMAEGPVQIRQVHSFLTNPYYAGVTTFKGVEYPGSHTPLIDRELFTKVQSVLRSKVNGERTIKHDHYLKSTLFCGNCESRMMVQVVKNGQGETYGYYACRGRHSKRKNCTLRSIQIEHVEDLIQDLYNRLTLQTDFRADLESLLRGSLKEIRADSDIEHLQLTTSKQDIERKQRKLLEAHYNDAIPLDVLKAEQSRLEQELGGINRKLNDAAADFTKADALITNALDIAQYMGGSYAEAPDHIRRLFNQLIFEMIEVIETDGETHQLRARLAPPFDLILGPATRVAVSEARLASSTNRTDKGQNGTKSKRPAETGGPFQHPSPSSAGIALDISLSKSIVVDLRGLEPLTPC